MKSAEESKIEVSPWVWYELCTTYHILSQSEKAWETAWEIISCNERKAEKINIYKDLIEIYKNYAEHSKPAAKDIYQQLIEHSERLETQGQLLPKMAGTLNDALVFFQQYQQTPRFILQPIPLIFEG